MEIKGIETTEEMVKIVAELVRQGATFVARKIGQQWNIELTGGY